jgi:glutamate dehydrogenase/leucine dehydrogenase
MKTEVSGALTGKYLNSGSSLVRPKATGEGCACFTAEMHAICNEKPEGKACLDAAEEYG